MSYRARDLQNSIESTSIQSGASVAPRATPTPQLNLGGSQPTSSAMVTSAAGVTGAARINQVTNKATDLTTKVMKTLAKPLGAVAGGIKAVQADRYKNYGSYGDVGMANWSPAKTIIPYRSFLGGAKEGWNNSTSFTDVLQQRHPDTPLSTSEAIAALGTDIGADPINIINPGKILAGGSKLLKLAKIDKLATKITPLVSKVTPEKVKLLTRLPAEMLSQKWEMGLEKYPEAFKAIRNLPYEIGFGNDKTNRLVTNFFKDVPPEHVEDMAKLMEPDKWKAEVPDIVARLKESGNWDLVQGKLHQLRGLGKEEVYSLAQKKIINGETAKKWANDQYLHHAWVDEGTKLDTELTKEKFGYLKERKGKEGYSLNLPDVTGLRMKKQNYDETVRTMKDEMVKIYGKPYDNKTGLMPGYKQFNDVNFNSQNKVQLPSEIVDVIEKKTLPKQQSSPSVQQAKSIVKSLDNAWRRMATTGLGIPRLQFTGRNMIGNAWNSYLAGMPLTRFPERYAEAAMELGKAQKANVWTKEMETAQRLGVLGGGWAGADITGEGVGLSKKVPGAVKDLVTGKTFSHVNRQAEDLSRYALWKEMLSQGKTEEEAAGVVRKALFNYGEITTTQKAVRTAVPFATWKFKNLPFQAESAINNTAKWTQPYKAKRAIESMSAEPDPAQVPTEAKNEFSVRTPGKGTSGEPKYRLPGGPWEELNSSTPREMFLSLHPGIKAPLEAGIPGTGFTGFNREVFSGRPVVPEEYPGALSSGERNKAQADYYKRQFLTYPLKPLRQLIPNTKLGKFLGSSASEQKYEAVDTILRQLTGTLTAKVLPEEEQYYYYNMSKAIKDNQTKLRNYGAKYAEGKMTEKDYQKVTDEILNRIVEITNGNF